MGFEGKRVERESGSGKARAPDEGLSDVVQPYKAAPERGKTY